MAWILAAIAVMAVAGLLIVTSNSKPERQQEHRQAAPTEDHGKAQPIADHDAKKDSEAGTKNNEQKHYGNGFRESLRWLMDVVEARDKFFTAFGTIIIAGFTVGLAIATAFLFFATRDLVKGADETAERQLRAYIGLHTSETTVYPFEKGGFAFIAHAELRNYGQTPAYDLTVRSNVKIDAPENVPFDDLPGLERGVPSIAFRDVGFHVNIGWPISEEDKVALYERRKVFFFWGRVEYKDAFDKPHHFTFHSVSGQIATGTGGVYTMGPHGPGYEVDK
jgi:hypothetical protein